MVAMLKDKILFHSTNVRKLKVPLILVLTDITLFWPLGTSVDMYKYPHKDIHSFMHAYIHK